MSEEPSRPSLTDEELAAYLRRRIAGGLVALLLLLVGIVLAGLFYEDEIRATAEWAVGYLGIPGILLITCIGDMFVTPFPPDVLLVVISESHLSSYWPLLVLAMGISSSMGGNVGWWLGRKLGHTRIPRLLMSRMRAEDKVFVTRYGRWGVAAGALTPLPFSLTCWLAGMLDLRLKDIWMMTLLRVPRFFIYYVLIYYSGELSKVF